MRLPERPGRGPHDRDILRLAIPALGALVAQPVYVLTDTAIVGHLGTDRLAGLAVASAILLSVSALVTFLAYGTTGTVGRHLGAGDQAGAAVQGVQGLWLAVGLGVVIAGVLAVAADPLIGLFHVAPAVAGHARTYLLISLVGLPSVLIVMAGTGYLRGLQDTRTPLVVALGTAVLNLITEVFLVYGLDLDIAGSAWSTVLAETVGGAVYVTVIVRTVLRLEVSIRPDPRELIRSLRRGLSLLVRTTALRGSFVVAALLASRLGTVALAGHEVATQVWTLLALALDAVAIAGQALVARHLGAGRRDLARDASRRMIELAVVVGVVAALAVLVAAQPLAELFSNDPEVISMTSFLLVWVAVMQPVGAHVFALDGILIGAGDLTFLARAMTGAALVFVTAGIATVALGLGIGWLWAALTLFMVVRSVTLHLRYRQDVWLVTGTT